ncbi:beta-1,4-mannosyltransferase egh-like [Mya arenaria]|uniref:beta-1,4-mannosyltransferase egh-like n=1 Tax=Mya arenaria TaxID=6604 RepID=UPI0022E2273C|nr:beta-1,4-mannosyltransferase egh-like [Mya arenaria]XP_052793877.1 beta-1,4-mannosyltransferase egh-like [Mya arenaria]XP_052793878.1 beta-1,4-mannosyltransferase egh-like [Mya arenaria]XP_052796851.1 beta-1,4-mannosyltransferase egh-like [Mya arenaria]XP_052796852.1 beta-1,4-mannosyltransferase egh-like [Mya arenaria]XP_052796853.1 beta-1,4-mannosyltransferase egh-like [Mya arenaria]XP_052796854.1 beta-1,4-mannosyltransferase egh-like [Mya arenaria]
MEGLSHILHVLTVGLLLIIILIFCVLTGGFGPDRLEGFDPFLEYGEKVTILLYILRFLTFVPIPQAMFNFCGLVMFNTHPAKPKLKTSTLFGPFICIRVVTRGTFPELVKKNVERNIEVCSRIGLDNYILEVVTDNTVNLPKSPRLREVVVPTKYQTKNHTLYKARALNYCLEPGVDMLTDNDWIVHLDEETLLTESSVIGIVNFINDGTYKFGQGVITYANEEIVSWITTLADLVRVGMDYGMIRFCLKYLHKPVFSWKGSFIVSNAAAEKQITYDFGVEGSIAEDCFFALTAWKEGHQFGFVEGEMWEKSTFSAKDYIYQRKRWVQGIYNVFFSSQISYRYKYGITLMLLSWVSMPFTVPNIVLVPLFPLPMWRSVNILCGFMGATMLFLFIFGAIKSFSPRRMGWPKYVFLCFLPIVIVPVSMVLETTGVVWALCTAKMTSFHIVNKQTTLPKQMTDLESTAGTVQHV